MCEREKTKRDRRERERVGADKTSRTLRYHARMKERGRECARGRQREEVGRGEIATLRRHAQRKDSLDPAAVEEEKALTVSPPPRHPLGLLALIQSPDMPYTVTVMALGSRPFYDRTY